jgi:putative ABC transport system permease protein
MMILVRKALRDLGMAKMRTASIILAIMLSTGIGIGLVNATRDAFESFDKRTEVTNYEDMDIMFDLAPIDIEAIEAIEGVGEVSGRLFIITQVQYGDEKYKAHWISSQYHNREPYAEINGYQFFEGDYVSSPDAREGLVGNLFAKANDVQPGDEATIIYGNLTLDIEVTGVVASPEYIYVVDETGWPQPSLLMPLFTTYEMAASALNITPGTYNELLINVDEGYDVDEVKKAVEIFLVANDIKISRSILGTEETDYLFSRVDANAMGQMGWAFGIIMLAVTAVVIYNSLSRLISTQRTYIGVMGALGGKPKRILLHYCLFGFFMGIIGSLLGVVFGYLLSYGAVNAYSELIGILEPVYTFYWIYPVIFTLLGTGIATLGALMGSFKALKVGPREALSSQYQTQAFSKKPLIEKMFFSSKRKRSILTRVPVRNISRYKFRTVITIIALACSLILVFTCLAMALGFDQPLQTNYEDYEKWDLKVTFAEPLDEATVNTILTRPEFGGLSAELHMDSFISIQHGDELEFAHLQAFESGSDMRNFNVIDGEKDLDDAMLVGSIVANDFDLEPGSEVTFVLGNSTRTISVSGITGELMDDSFLMTLDLARDVFQTDHVVNALVIDLGSMSRAEAESALRANFAITSVAYTDDVVEGMEVFMEGLVGMLFIFIGFGIVAEVLFISTTVVLNILDREMEFISLRAIGANPGKIRSMIVNESMILLVFGLIIGLPLAYYATQWAMWYIVQDLMYYELGIGISTYLITAIIAIISTTVASFVSSRHITKQKLADAIRHRSVS